MQSFGQTVGHQGTELSFGSVFFEWLRFLNLDISVIHDREMLEIVVGTGKWKVKGLQNISKTVYYYSYQPGPSSAPLLPPARVNPGASKLYPQSTAP